MKKIPYLKSSSSVCKLTEFYSGKPYYKRTLNDPIESFKVAIVHSDAGQNTELTIHRSRSNGNKPKGWTVTHSGQFQAFLDTKKISKTRKEKIQKDRSLRIRQLASDNNLIIVDSVEQVYY